jgi:hypothetical protein
MQKPQIGIGNQEKTRNDFTPESYRNAEQNQLRDAIKLDLKQLKKQAFPHSKQEFLSIRVQIKEGDSLSAIAYGIDNLASEKYKAEHNTDLVDHSAKDININGKTPVYYPDGHIVKLGSKNSPIIYPGQWVRLDEVGGALIIRVLDEGENLDKPASVFSLPPKPSSQENSPEVNPPVIEEESAPPSTVPEKTEIQQVPPISENREDLERKEIASVGQKILDLIQEGIDTLNPDRITQAKVRYQNELIPLIDKAKNKTDFLGLKDSFWILENCPHSAKEEAIDLINIYTSRRINIPPKYTSYEEISVFLGRQLGDKYFRIVIQENLQETILETPPDNVTSKEIGQGIRMIKINSFHGDVVNEVRNYLTPLPTGVVFDLRGNPGGEVTIVQDLIDLFKKEGLILAEQSKYSIDTPLDPYRMDDEVMYAKNDSMPLENFNHIAVLVDKDSASASEVFAGNMKHMGHLVIGEETFGKNSVQTIFELKDPQKHRLVMTTANYFVPGGDQPPITPNIELENPNGPEAEQTAVQHLLNWGK